MDWFTSWIPDLPHFNFAIPASIQGRFISFVLKKTLGHFLKPGQLDYRQIDSQIGSGYVQVSDLELDTQNINSYLNDLPIRLHNGTISSVKVRIPWPNPLSSTLGFSIKSLHLTFHLTPQDCSQREHIDLTDSVASVAQSFIHEELSAQEDAMLWNTLNKEVHTEHYPNIVPGDFASLSNPESAIASSDTDPTGVSVFAGLIERLLAKFEFDTEDVHITLVHPGNIQISLSIAEIKYLTRTTRQSTLLTEHSAPEGETRTLSITGLSLTSRNLNSPYTQHDPTPEASIGVSPISSDSSIDEQMHAFMSESLAFLPPTQYSPTTSASSSMYESAISSAQSFSSSSPASDHHGTWTVDDTPEPKPQISESQTTFEEVIITFGNQPIVFELSTPPTISSPSTNDDPFITFTNPIVPKAEFKATLSMGVIACVIRPWQVHALTRIAQINHSPYKDSIQDSRPNKSALKIPPMELKGQIRAILLLIIPSNAPDEICNTEDFFSKPLIPPVWDIGYSRLHLDSVNIEASYQKHRQTSSLTVEDLSLFFFIPNETRKIRAFPVLITDPSLVEQYPRAHIQPDISPQYQGLPSFEDFDWSHAKYEKAGIRLSQWRSQPLTAGLVPKALKISSQQTKSTERENKIPDDDMKITVDVAPIHIRLHFGQLLQPKGPLTFFEELSATHIGDDSSISSDHTVDQHYYQTGTSSRMKMNEAVKVQKTPSRPTITMRLPFVRASLRCPSPSSTLPNRSGSIVLDVHSIKIVSGASSQPVGTRFANQDTHIQVVNELLAENVVLQAQFNRVLVALSAANSSVATGFASIGTLQEPIGSDKSHFDGERFDPIRPNLSLIQRDRNVSHPSVMALSIEIPGVYLDVTKYKLDALQYWVDDLTQFIERASASEEEPGSGQTSIVGSRFFVNSRTGSTMSSSTTEKSETVIKLTITEGFANISLPRCDLDKCATRPFVVKCSDMDVLVEMNPDHKHQTIITLAIDEIVVENTTKDNTVQRFLTSTPSKSLASRKPVVKLRFSSSMLPISNIKESKINATLTGFAFSYFSDTQWISDMAELAKNPPNTFESVVPNDRTRISVKVNDGSVCVFGAKNPGALVAFIQDTTFATDVVDDSDDSSFQLLANELSLLFIDHVQDQVRLDHPQSISTWTAAGYALLAEVGDLNLNVVRQVNPMESMKVLIYRIVLRLHLCADTTAALTHFFGDLGSVDDDGSQKEKPSQEYPSIDDLSHSTERSLMSSVDDVAFKRVPAVGHAPDMIDDDLPTNIDYLDESFGTAAGLREILDEDMDEFDQNEYGQANDREDSHIISRVGGETIKIFDNGGLAPVEDYYLNISPDTSETTAQSNNATFSVRVQDAHLNLFLYDGYDWAKTRKTIEEEVKDMRKRLLKIRQLVATGQMQDSTVEDTSALLYNSVRIGLVQDEDALAEPSALIAAIDEELDEEFETSSQSSWQSLRPTTNAPKPRPKPARITGKRLKRSKAPSMEFCIRGANAEFDKYPLEDPLVSRTFVTVKDLEILDHIKTSTWKKFLTELRSDSRGNIRETDSNMVRVEIRTVRPVAGNTAEEVRLRAKLLPLRLYVDQDAVDFLKKFFSFQDPNAAPSAPSDDTGAFIQLGEIFPIDLKLDYKPRRVDYRALKEGKTIELMNFFHFDGAEMTLRHITLAGVTGWGKFFETLNDLWTPDVKATQLVEVISGVAPIRSVVNVGSGVADLILLPIAQYKKDGRIVRGVQKGATSFVKSTAIEVIKMGAQLATGTQVILEQAEGILGGRFEVPLTADSVQVSASDDVGFDELDEEATADLISKYAQQPDNLKEGMQFAYKSLQRNFSSAAQTILAVPMEVYERSGNEGPVRSVIRAVPIAVLKPMIGASEAVSKTLLGLHNTLDPNVRLENEAKYKN